LSGLLLALPLCEDDSRLTVKGLKSAPYVRMTLQLLERFGITLNASPNLDRIEVMGRQSYRPAQISIEGDWSGAAFMLVAGALAGRATVQGLALDSTQPDRAIVDALRLAGAEVELRGDSVTAQRSGLLGFAFDATQCPDLFPPLVALAVGAQGETVLSGASRLRHKESDRARALVEEFRKMGARLDLRGDHLRVQGGSLEGGTVDAHGDHRIAMAVSIAGLVSRSGADLTGEGSVAKSYPDFFERLQALRVNP
jgi:3-phosphoshikimate 1-carboxyvinyltransferase